MRAADLPPMFRRPVPGHARFVRFFGLRLQLVVGIAVAGVAGGAAGSTYLWVLDGVDRLVGPERWASVGVRSAVLIATGAVVAVLVRVLGRPASVDLVVDNIHLPDRRAGSEARLRSLLPASLLCIGVGGTLGPEAPVVTTTATLSHRAAHRWSSLDGDDIRIVTMAGMAAGFAVLFGAPFGAALFALEIPHRRGIGYHEAIVPAVIGSSLGFVASVIGGRHGLEPVWNFDVAARLAGLDLAWAVLAGAVGAAVAVAFTIVVGALGRTLRAVPTVVLPVVGGAALALLAWWSPYALTNGEYQVDELLVLGAGGALAVAALAKLLASAVLLVCGWRGGFIIPLFVVGLASGVIVADVLAIEHPLVFAVGVMAAANVGVTKTPLGSSLVVTEMSAMAVLPSTVLASLVALVLTAPVALIEAQRDPVRHRGPEREQDSEHGG